MTVTATELIGKAIQGYEALQAASTTFKNRIGTGTTTAQATDRIFYPHLDSPDDYPTPFFTITPDVASMVRDDSSYRTNQVALIVRCCDVARMEVDKPLSLKDCLIDFLNFAGGSFTDAFEGSQTSTTGAVTIQSIADVEPVAFTDPRKESEKSTKRPYCLMTRRVVVALTGGGQQ